VALNANPIGLIVLAIAALVAAVILAWKNSETFRNIVMAVWNGIKAAGLALWNALKAAFNGIKAAFTSSINAIRSVAQTVWNAIVAVVKFYINLYRSIIMGVINFVRGAWNGFLNGLRAVARAVWAAIVAVITGYINRIKAVVTGIKALIANVKNTFARIKEAAVTQLLNLINFVRQLPGKVTSALGNIGRLLFNKGRDLIKGFINGIASMIGAVKDKVKDVVGAVGRFLPGSPAKEGPLSGQGYVLLRGQRFMADFARGIAQGSQLPTSALLGAIGAIGRNTNPIRSTMPVRTGGDRSTMPVTSAPSQPTTRTYPISIGQEHFVDLVVDAITGEPIAVAKAADEGSRRSRWAGSGRR
jgi:phage-related protein